LSRWLASRLRDHWRDCHDEWRRDSRGATAYALPVPTQLALEHAEKEGAETAFAARDESRLIDSLLTEVASSAHLSHTGGRWIHVGSRWIISRDC
jgi:hypothetical protein